MKIVFHHFSLHVSGKTLIEETNLTIDHFVQWAITGESGSGKTLLAKAIAKKLFFRGRIEFFNEKNELFEPNIVLIDQQHRFRNKSHVEDFYYQQRFNAADAEDTLTVEEELSTLLANDTKHWIEIFQLTPLLKKPIIQLSNGENKRLQLTKALSQQPDLIILDNPFIGMDAEGRKTLNKMLNQITENGTKIILITSPHTLPSCINKVSRLHQGNITDVAVGHSHEETENTFPVQLPSSILDAFKINNGLSFEFAVKMKDVCITYNNHQILQHINWEVRRGERWCIKGHNGSGKSTLVSLITADNPQAYANEIHLFDRKKGSGESIWEIKKNIGFVSPELHLFFDKGFTAFEAIASGMFDTIGLFKKLNSSQEEMILVWMDVLKILEWKDRYLHQLSLGQQRLIMLARALVKMPPLLVLDEPCQGLDEKQTIYFKNIIDSICTHSDVTLIYISHFTQDIPNSIRHYMELGKGKIIV